MSRTVSRVTVQRFGEKLKMLRVRQQLTLQQFAESLGYSAHGYLSELESGKKAPSIELVLIVSRVYNISTDVLLKDELDLRIEAIELKSEHKQ
jgi:transcriptional regulator with XRE-family HTH domain